MATEMTEIDTLVVGAGQAGVAISEHLGKLGVPHLVLERSRIAEAWRTGRWDSLVANGPAWHDRFPGLEFPDLGPDDFASKEQVAHYLETYARMIEAPIRTGVEVRQVIRNQGRPGFCVETSQGTLQARRVVVATGPFQRPVIPAIAPQDTALNQLHSAHYRNPDQLPAGAVLVIGAGSSGTQIADELQRAGRTVYLSVGQHDRPPRAYRQRDFCWWLGVLGQWDAAAMQPGREHVTIAVSGAQGGRTVDFRELAQRGLKLVGLTRSIEQGVARFAPDLAENLARGDANYLKLLDDADDYVARNGLDLPLDPRARQVFPDADCISHPILELDLAEAGITTLIWATGFATDYRWLKVDAFDSHGKPRHQRGVSSEPGIYFLGLPWQSRRGSSFIWGVWHDARFIADQIAIQRQYLTYRDAAERSIQATCSLSPLPESAMSTPTHTRIRMFNTQETYPNQSLDNDLCQAVRAGNTVYVRGQVGTDFEGNLVGLGDPRAQAEQAMKNLRQLLEEAGSDLSHIVKTTTYLTDPRYREPVYQEVGKWLKGVFPISTGLVVSALGQPQWLMEIDVIAVIPQDWAPSTGRSDAAAG
jgi:putative flavoprotein involved in K+ transport